MIYQQVVGTMQALRDAVEEQFKKVSDDGFCLLTLMPGEVVPFDYCDRCDNGMAWVRLVSMQPSEEQSDQRVEGRCFADLSMTVEVGHIFAAPWPDADGDLPEEHEHSAATLRQIECADVMLTALLCTDLPDDVFASRPSYAPVGPDGGCLGGVWTATIGLI